MSGNAPQPGRPVRQWVLTEDQIRCVIKQALEKEGVEIPPMMIMGGEEIERIVRDAACEAGRIKRGLL